jgi:putative phosphoesterase
MTSILLYLELIKYCLFESLTGKLKSLIMRIAIISDIHGNLVSLDAVLKDIKSYGVDQIVFLGDAATLGPQPTEVIARLSEIKCLCILGNHDEYMIRPKAIDTYTKDQVIVNTVAWCKNLLSASDIEFLSTFQRNIEIPLNETISLVCYHGSPLSNTDIILSETPALQVDHLINHEMNDIYAGGHTHIQMLRQHKGHYIVNPGSVGQPFSEFNYNRPPHILQWAEYAIIRFEKKKEDIVLKRVQISKQKIRKEIKASNIPMKKWLLEQYA